ncbi:hypothetical protein MCOR27_000607 [Pyricularia oryzae]|nr:hypothetical protein MCOR27_000607 [Pyricularia oryzae]KAI6358591.1 hypothetical protein MCOR31_009803 [Pyricularia oryzae]KAI6380081.1 hypothetical protein MCOR32_004228 [Pyricularia oryzae]KAI6405718.1 hypothetical protein MCOR23_002535 [Pyricularia oryzae]KAI6414614.1 hypothetical protein MCOR20_002127 [Pyricularia oryzae]
MSPATRREFLQAVHKGLHDVPYVVIGGSALAEYGSSRETGDVDVLVGSGCSKRSAESLLIKRTEGRLVRIGHGKIIFRASDGNIYPLDLSEDHEVDLKFEQARDTASLKNSPGYKLANFVFLLNSKAHAWQTRVPFEPKFHEKRRHDAQDIIFCLERLSGRRDIDRAELSWVYTNEFWNQFVEGNPRARQLFTAAGLWTDETVFVTGRTISARSSLSSFASPWTQPGTPARQDSNLSQAGWGSGQGSRAGSMAIPNSRQASVDSYGSRHGESRWATPEHFDEYGGSQRGHRGFGSGFAHGPAHASMVSVRG